MKYALSISLLSGLLAIVACGDSGDDDGDDGSSTTGETIGCSVATGCFEIEVQEGRSKAQTEQDCSLFGGTPSDTCPGTKLGCCKTSSGQVQCWYGELSADGIKLSCEMGGGTWTPA